MAGTGNREYIVLPIPTTTRTTRVLVATAHEDRTPDDQIGLIVAANQRHDTFSDAVTP